MEISRKSITKLLCAVLVLLLLKYIFIDMPEKWGHLTRLVKAKRLVVSFLTGRKDVGQSYEFAKERYERAVKLALEAQRDIQNNDQPGALDKFRKASSILKDLITRYPEWDLVDAVESKLRGCDTLIVDIMMGQIIAEPVGKRAEVTKVYDGDTIEIDNEEVIRYIGMNTPERDTPLYEEARMMNEELCGDKEVVLKYGEERYDVYGRTLAYVFVGDTCVNAELVREGLARELPYGRTKKYGLLFEKLEEIARLDRNGLWSMKPSERSYGGE